MPYFFRSPSHFAANVAAGAVVAMATRELRSLFDPATAVEERIMKALVMGILIGYTIKQVDFNDFNSLGFSVGFLLEATSRRAHHYVMQHAHAAEAVEQGHVHRL